MWRNNAFDDDPPELHIDRGWTGQGPDLETVDGSIVLSSWGCDAWGVTVCRADAELIANAPSDIATLLASVERYRELIVQLEAENANQAAELAFWKDEEPHPSQLVHDLAGVDGYEGCRGGACVCTEDEG